MKVILVRTNYKSHIITPPLGLGYLSSYLKMQGFSVVIIDALKENLSLEQLLQKIISEKPYVVGITCLTSYYKEVVELSRGLKLEGIKCVIGGVHPTFFPFETLVDSEADYVICGEGEIAFSKLLKNKLINDTIQGVYSLDNLRRAGESIVKGEIVVDLDDLSFPDWEQLDPNTYPKAPHGAIVKHFPIGIITTTRGCPYECTFCASPKFYERKIRFRNPKNVVEEIIYLKKNFGIKEVHFEDDNLTFKRSHIEEICQLLLKHKLNISWACPNGIRADKVDEELIALMAKSGCYYFSYGIESANPLILQNIKKRESISQIERAIEMADKNGISCQGFFIFGLPGETKETIEESIRFAVKSKLSRAQFLILDVLPGSELWEKLEGKFIPNWQKNSYKEPEWIPASLSREELQSAQSMAFRRFYLRLIIFYKLAKMINWKQIHFLWQRLAEYRLLRQRHE